MGKRMIGKVKKIVAVAMVACMLFTMAKVNSNAGIMLCSGDFIECERELE